MDEQVKEEITTILNERRFSGLTVNVDDLVK